MDCTILYVMVVVVMLIIIYCQKLYPHETKHQVKHNIFDNKNF